MPELDIKVSADLQELFKLPPCEMIRLPAPKPLKVQLPTGGSISALTDISKGIPTDCSMAFNLLAQIGPILASTECLFKVLKLLKPLIDIINGLPIPPVKAIQEFAKAAIELAPCLLVPTPLNMIPFIRDILCLVLRMLKCFLSQLKSLAELMGGLQIQISSAQDDGNSELEESLQCSMENAQVSGQHLTKAIEPIGIILGLLEPMLGIAGMQPIQIPAIGSETDLQALQNVIQTLQGVVGTIQVVVDAIGGCPE